jgi:hypothetical protein
MADFPVKITLKVTLKAYQMELGLRKKLSISSLRLTVTAKAKCPRTVRSCLQFRLHFFARRKTAQKSWNCRHFHSFWRWEGWWDLGQAYMNHTLGEDYIVRNWQRFDPGIRQAYLQMESDD